MSARDLRDKFAVSTIRIPPRLADAVDGDDYSARLEWLAALPALVTEIATGWELELDNPYLPGGQCAWVAPVRDSEDNELVLKVGWRHREAEHEAEALRFWDGDGAVRCFRIRSLEDTTALLLERCVPGEQLGQSLPESEQDVVIAGLMRRLWARKPADGEPFGSLVTMCDLWAEWFELEFGRDSQGLDPGLAREGMAMLRELPRSADREVLLCTDLHAGNVLSAQREPWLVIDPKPFIGDPAFEPVQHMFNCEERLAADPEGLSRRMAELLELDAERVRLWLCARCVQESIHHLPTRQLARRLAP
jgi:streptomycin 6-kinase